MKIDLLRYKKYRLRKIKIFLFLSLPLFIFILIRFNGMKPIIWFSSICFVAYLVYLVKKYSKIIITAEIVNSILKLNYLAFNKTYELKIDSKTNDSIKLLFDFNFNPKNHDNYICLIVTHKKKKRKFYPFIDDAIALINGLIDENYNLKMNSLETKEFSNLIDVYNKSKS